MNERVTRQQWIDAVVIGNAAEGKQNTIDRSRVRNRVANGLTQMLDLRNVDRADRHLTSESCTQVRGKGGKIASIARNEEKRPAIRCEPLGDRTSEA